MIDSRMHTFMAGLHQARSFEQAAEILLELLSGAAGPALLLRGMVHLRPDDAYKGFFARAYGSGGTAGVDPTPSTTAWRWLEIRRAPVLLDARAGLIIDVEGTIVERDQWPLDAGSFRSRERVLGRQTSHIMAFPLRRPGGRLDGFVSLELALDSELEPDIWPGRAAEIDFLVSVAAPFLLALPRAPLRVIEGDRWLPAVGERTRELLELLEAYVERDGTLLLKGETGVGKTRLATWCWKHSPRADKPFESVNLATENEDLRADLLFGHKKGAYTDAHVDRQGLVTMVDGGTLFIDEIDKLSMRGQAMLLSLLDNGHYRVIGDSETRHADVRFIVGSNIDLKQAVAEGRFRDDLYQRINVFPVRLLPLRERRDEIARWAQHFIDELHRKTGRGGAATLQAAAGTLLEGQPWPGNLRKLHTIMERAHAFACRDAAGQDLEVRIQHVERALAQDHDEPVSAGLWRALDQAAHAFVDLAAARPDGLSLEHGKAFAGLVVRRAIERLGNDKAYVVLKQAGYLKSGNRNKLTRISEKQIDALELEIGSMNDRS